MVSGVRGEETHKRQMRRRVYKAGREEPKGMRQRQRQSQRVATASDNTAAAGM